jgi:hypothetical protein
MSRVVDAILDFMYSHQVLSWVGIVVSVISGGGFLFQLFGVAALIGALFGWSTQRQSTPIRYVSCLEQFTLEGRRGCVAKSESTVQFEFKKEMESFIFGTGTTTGTIEEDRYYYRNLGRYGKNKDAAERQMRDGATQLGQQVVEGRHIFIRLPTPAEANDQYEIRRTYSVSNSFEGDVEEAGKLVLYPCKLLKMQLKFMGCEPKNVIGYVSKFSIPVSGSQVDLDVVSDGNGGFFVDWTKCNAEPGERYTVQWSWKE